MARRAPLISRKQALTAMGALSSLQAMVIAGDASAAGVGTSSATLFITAAVMANCLIDNAHMDFSTFTVLQGSAAAPTYNVVNATATIPYACTNAWPAQIMVGSNSVALTNAGSDSVVAKLYADNSFSTLYPTQASASGVAVNGSGSAASTPIYGQITTDHTTKADSYSGSTQLTISY